MHDCNPQAYISSYISKVLLNNKNSSIHIVSADWIESKTRHLILAHLWEIIWITKGLNRSSSHSTIARRPSKFFFRYFYASMRSAGISNAYVERNSRSRPWRRSCYLARSCSSTRKKKKYLVAATKRSRFSKRLVYRASNLISNRTIVSSRINAIHLLSRPSRRPSLRLFLSLSLYRNNALCRGCDRHS